MRVFQGQKVSFSLPDGRPIDGIVLDEEPTLEKVTVKSRLGKMIDVIVSRVSVLSQRTSLEGVTYKTISNEVVDYGYSPKMTPRFNTVIGLDATADGEVITLQANIEQVQQDRQAFLKGLFDARHEVVDAASV